MNGFIKDVMELLFYPSVINVCNFQIYIWIVVFLSAVVESIFIPLFPVKFIIYIYYSNFASIATVEEINMCFSVSITNRL